MSRTAASYYVATDFRSFDTQEEAAEHLAESDDGAPAILVKGTQIEFTVNREPTVTFGAPVKPPRKPRKRTSTAAVAEGDTLAVMKVNKDGSVRRKPGRKPAAATTVNGESHNADA